MTKTPSHTRILITGGAGFIGSNLAHRLNQLGHTDITIVDRLGKTDKWRNLVGLRYRQYIEVDAFSPFIASSYDVVFHLGACSSTRQEDASYLMRNNLAFSVELARASLAGGTRFIYASSAATYGNGPASDHLSPHVLRPTNPYGLSKNAFDQYAEAAGWLDRIVGLKYSNVWGAGCEHKGVMISFPTKVFGDVRRDGYVSMYDTYLTAPGGPERDARDFLYVKDAVEMTIHFAFGRGAQAAGLFNLGAGEATRWSEVARLTIEAMGLKVDNAHPQKPDERISRVRYTPMPAALKGRYQYYTCADIGKLRASGYDKPITPIAEAIHDYVRDYLTPDLRVGERAIAARQPNA